MTALLLALLVAAPADRSSAQALLDAGNFEAALGAVDRELKKATPVQRASLQVLRARCLLALRKTSDAELALETGLTENPALTLAGLDVSPAFEAMFQQARVRLAGTVEVDTEPTGSGVRVDGVVAGVAPLRQVLPVGAHVIETVDRDGTVLSRRELVLAPRERQTLVLRGAQVVSVSAEKPAPPSVVQPPPSPSAPLPIVPFASGRAQVDLTCPSCGVRASFEGGAGVVGRWFVAEVDFIAGGAMGLGLRAGPRLAFMDGLLAAQLTANGALFFDVRPTPGLGGALGLSVRPLRFLDFVLEVAGHHLWGAADVRPDYLLAGLSTRVRWPTSEADF